MSEEFYMSATFEMQSVEQMEALETLIEHFDLCEVDEARALLAQNHLSKAQGLIDQLTDGHSDYDNESDLVKMFVDTYNDSADDMELTIDESGIKAEISVEGWDREAIDFCAALVLILVAMGADRIQAKAGSAMWNARWLTGDKEEVKFQCVMEE